MTRPDLSQDYEDVGGWYRRKRCPNCGASSPHHYQDRCPGDATLRPLPLSPATALAPAFVPADAAVRDAMRKGKR